MTDLLPARTPTASTIRPGPPGWAAQLGALVSLRWRMIRNRGVRAGLLTLAIGLLGLLVVVVVGARLLPDDARFETAILAPTALLGFAVLALVAPLTAGGGNELYPAEQLAPHPVRPSTLFAASLVVAPLNLVWISQLVTVLAVASFLVPLGAVVWPTVVLALGYVLAVTVTGQSLSWLVIGIRQTRRGRTGTWAVAGAVVVLVLGVVRTGHVGDVLDKSPTLKVVAAMLGGSTGGDWWQWARMLVGLAVVTALACRLGVRTVGWTLRRPGDTGMSRESRRVRRRAQHPSALLELVAVNRASVWRSSALRRGAFVLAVLPGLAAGGAGVDWDSLIVLPGLVAAGAELLFGVNAFCLDASGAVWLASLPVRPRTVLLAKLWVITETCLAPVLLAAAAGAVRIPRLPTPAEAVALLVGLTVCVGYVSATCLRLSVARPHRADLRGSRDTPAPPATMAVYSARLAAVTTILGLVVAGAGATDIWWASLVVGVPGWLLIARSLVRTGRLWDDPVRRAGVVATVASG